MGSHATHSSSLTRWLWCLQVPPPLGIGTVILEDGSSVKGFICEGWVAKGSPPDIVDITHLGGWRQFLASREQQ